MNEEEPPTPPLELTLLLPAPPAPTVISPLEPEATEYDPVLT